MDFHLVKQKGQSEESLLRFKADTATQAIGIAEQKFGDMLGGHVLYQVEQLPVMRWCVFRDAEMGDNL